MMKLIFGIFLLSLIFPAFSQDPQNSQTFEDIGRPIDEKLTSRWYEKLSLRGYAQFRYNRIAESNKDLRCDSCDKSIGDKQGFFLRRARIILAGQITDRVFVYIQPDYASESGNQNYLQMRDAYFDYSLTEDAEWRIRTGNQKIPFGFENLQSSGNRAPLDRSDSLNTGVPNERDIGVFLMYAPAHMRDLFRELATLEMKGSGDYGMIALGAYNGQTINRRERNNDLHRALRLTYPHKFSNGQIVEASLQAYEGKFYVESANAPAFDKNVYDGRQAATFVLYPRPFGIQAEYNVGRSPEYSPEKNAIVSSDVKGGYAQFHYLIENQGQRYFPFARFSEFQGGRKVENGALGKVREWELGTEWQSNSALEITVSYMISDRLLQSRQNNRLHEQGSMIRIQAQFIY